MSNKNFSLQCPLAIQSDTIQLAHGGGGRLTKQLIDQLFVPSFDNQFLNRQGDSAVLNIAGQRLAFTTDSYIVEPLFFPGGDIGELAVSGTVNDLAMMGALPLYLSLALIIEEGFDKKKLEKIIHSIAKTAKEAGVEVVTGDTKVIERGAKGGELYINTSGIGVLNHTFDIDAKAIKAGDKIIVSGDIGRHGMAVMTQREGLEFEAAIQSDVACLHFAVLDLLKGGCVIHCLRDLTRGGLATSLIELAQSSGFTFHLQEKMICVDSQVKAACEILGFDPLYVANEGRFTLIVPEAEIEKTLSHLKESRHCENATIIGEVQESRSYEKGMVVLENAYGTQRVLDMLSGEQLPRIC